MKYTSARKLIEQIAYTTGSDIDWLFCYVLKIKRSRLITVDNITKSQFIKLKKYAKRLRTMPLSIAIGETEFLGLKIKVNKQVLTPREETEELADYVIKNIGNNNCKVLDLCCGSGAIGISVAKLTNSVVTCADISGFAIKTTKQNCKLHNVSVNVIKSDMLNNVWGTFDFIVCNPPYIKLGDSQVEDKVDKNEPHLALYAPNNGYYFYEYLSKNVCPYLKPKGKLCLEVGKDMAQNVARMFDKFAKVEIIKDMQNIDRFVIVTK